MTDEYLTGPNGTYRLLQRIGAGGMGIVHLALDEDGRTLAVKELHPSLIDDDMLARLEREVTSMHRVSSPYVAEIRDADVRGERPFVATRYVQGRALDRTVKERGPLEGPRLVHVARHLATALQAIHDAGIIHRDLKPSNVMLSEGDPVIIDFGIAQAIDATRLTHTGVVVGTPGYVAPEVVNGGEAEQPADIFAWAATVAYAATGRSPFGTGPAEVVFFRVAGGQSDLHGVPEPLMPVLRAALARDPGARPTAGELAEQLATLRLDAPAEETGGAIGEDTGAAVAAAVAGAAVGLPGDAAEETGDLPESPDTGQSDEVATEPAHDGPPPARLDTESAAWPSPAQSGRPPAAPPSQAPGGPAQAAQWGAAQSAVPPPPAQPHQAPPSQAHPGTGGPSQPQTPAAQASQSQAGQALAGQGQPGQAQAGQAPAGQAPAGQAQVGQGQQGQAQAGQAQVGQALVGQGQPGQGQPSQAQGGQVQAGYGQPGQHVPGVPGQVQYAAHPGYAGQTAPTLPATSHDPQSAPRLGIGLGVLVVAGATALAYVLPVVGVLVAVAALIGLGVRDRIRPYGAQPAGAAFTAMLWRVAAMFAAAGIVAWLFEAGFELVAGPKVRSGQWQTLGDTPTSTILAAFVALAVLLATAVPRWRGPARALAVLVAGGTPTPRYVLIGVCALAIIAALFTPAPSWFPLPLGSSVSLGEVLR